MSLPFPSLSSIPRFSRRRGLGLLAAALLGASSLAGAQGSDGPLTIIVPYAPGGAPDVLAREVAPRLAARLKRTVLVDNKPGAAGNIGAAYVAKTAAPGSALLLATQPMVTINPLLFKNMGFEVRDLTPVTAAVNVVLVAAVNSSLPARNLSEFVNYAKAHPGTAYGTSGIGTPMHLAGLRLQRMAGTPLTHVAYRGAAPNITDLLAGNIQMSIVDYATSKPFADEGRLRILGIGEAARMPGADGVPTLRESVPGFDITSWFAFFARSGTPQTMVDQFATELRAVLQEPEMRQKLLARGMVERAEGPDALAKLVKDDAELFAPVVRDNHVTVE